MWGWFREWDRSGRLLAGPQIGSCDLVLGWTARDLAGFGHAAAPPSLRLTGALLIEQNDEWLVCRRYLSEESLALVLEDQGEDPREQAAQLQAA